MATAIVDPTVRLLNLKEAADFLGIRPVTLYNFYRPTSAVQNKPTVIRLGRRMMWREFDLRLWMAEICNGGAQ